MDLEPIDERPERILNFSRPRPRSQVSYDSTNTLVPAPPPPRVRALEAFREPNRAQLQEKFPDEPRFSDDSDGTDNASKASELAWDGQRGELVSTPKAAPTVSLDSREQRTAAPSLSRGSSAGSVPRLSTAHANGSTGTISNGKPPPPHTALPPKGILKHSFVSQHSERAASSDTASDMGIEDGASHHTVSEDGSYNNNYRHNHTTTESPDTSTSSSSSTLTTAMGVGSGKWSSSDYDISSLSEKQRKKLEKKGVNPALYLEMKAARAGKGRIGALTGNTYVS